MKAFTTPVDWLTRSITVSVIGAGGTGSKLLDALARTSLALKQLNGTELKVIVWDDDTVSESNIIRQRFWAADIGENKAEVLVERHNAYHGTNWEAVPQRLTEYYDLNQSDLVITCVDSASTRHQMGEFFEVNNAEDMFWLDCGNGDRQGQVVFGHCNPYTEKMGLPNVYNLFENQLLVADDDDQPSCSAEEALQKQDLFINDQMAVWAGELLWSLLRHGGLDHHGMWVDLDSKTVNPLKIDPEQWKLFGYNA